MDPEGKEVGKGEVGELYLSGSQITKGYLNNDEKTKSQFIIIGELGDSLWYRTGDLVKEENEGFLYYVGRIDNQVQIRGHRVELQEIDHVIKRITSEAMVCSVAWPQQGGISQGVVAFICTENSIDTPKVLKACKDFLPEYMMPSQLYLVDDFPLNSNGKIDRVKLVDSLKVEKV